jgi:hypothetical protein
MGERVFNFELLEQEANIVMNALGQRPFAEVEQLVNKIRLQASVQLKQSKTDTKEGPAGETP